MAAIRIRTSLTGLNIPQYHFRSLARSGRKAWYSQSRDVSSAATSADHNAIHKGENGVPEVGSRKQRKALRRREESLRMFLDLPKNTVSPILLRDMCSCPRCIDPSTRQKLFSTTEIPPNIQVNTQTEKSNAIEITWDYDIPSYNDNHTSTIPLNLLQRILETRATTPKIEFPKKVLWSKAEFETNGSTDIPYEDYMTNDLVLYTVVRQLHQYGLVFINGVPESGESVSKIAERIGPLKTTFYGRTWDVRSVPQATNVAYTSQNLGFHMDLLYMQQPPHIQLLHCIRSSASGGASLFTDSFKSAIDLAKADVAAFRGLVEGRVDFHYDHPGSQYYHQARRVVEAKRIPVTGQPVELYQVLKWQKQRESYPVRGDYRLEDYIDAVSWSPPFQAPFSTDIPGLDKPREPKSANIENLGAKTQLWHSHARKFDRLIHRPEVIYERMMKPGECVLFDNRRVLHARRAFEVGDLGKERWLRGAYIDKDPFISKLKILQDSHGSPSDESDGNPSEERTHST